jgi:hypothetical protein
VELNSDEYQGEADNLQRHTGLWQPLPMA